MSFLHSKPSRDLPCFREYNPDANSWPKIPVPWAWHLPSLLSLYPQLSHSLSLASSLLHTQPSTPCITPLHSLLLQPGPPVLQTSAQSSAYFVHTSACLFFIREDFVLPKASTIASQDPLSLFSPLLCVRVLHRTFHTRHTIDACVYLSPVSSRL